MSDLLHIEVSPQGENSISRAIAKEFIDTLKELNPDAIIVSRDLAAEPIPHLDGETVKAGYTPEKNRSESMKAKHDFRMQLVNEVNEAKHILVSTPMWNWSVPSVLKAWIDQIIVGGVTKINGKVTVVVAQGGSYAEGRPRAGWDWTTGYLRQVFTSQGASDVEIILSEYGLAGIAPGMEKYIEEKKSSIENAKTTAKIRAAA